MKPVPTTTPGERLAKFLDDEFPEQRIARCLGEIAAATVTTRAGTTEPDYKTRLAAISLALAYKHGRPIERSEIRTQNIPATDEAMLEVLAKSGEARRAFRDYIKLAETKAATVDV